MVLEPWDKSFDVFGLTYDGPSTAPIRIWGTRRLLALARLLPLVVLLDGNGNPVAGQKVNWTFGTPGEGQVSKKVDVDTEYASNKPGELHGISSTDKDGKINFVLTGLSESGAETIVFDVAYQRIDVENVGYDQGK